MKTLIISIGLLLGTIGAFAQQPRKSITDTVFQLEAVNVKETIKKKVNLLNMDVPLKTLLAG